MSSRPSIENSGHDEFFLLLPWYVNGTLNGDQKTLTDEHVRSCIVCRRALANEYRTLDVFRNENPSVLSVQSGLERLHDRIAARSVPASKNQRAASGSTAWSRAMEIIRSFTGGSLRPALIAAPLAVISVSFLLTYLAQKQPVTGGYGITGAVPATDGYHTLSNPEGVAANADDVHVVFSPGTDIKAIEELFNSVPAKLIAGPDNAGVYTVRLAVISGKDEREAAIIGLRGLPHVIFAEASQPLSVPQPAETESP